MDCTIGQHLFLMPIKSTKDLTPEDVIRCLPDNGKKNSQLGNMNFMDIQVNASVTGQGPYPETVFGRGVTEPSIDFMQDLYSFKEPELRNVVERFYQDSRKVGDAIL